MTSKLGFYLHSSQDNHGLWGLFERIKPPVILIHLEAKNDDLLRQMREWRSPDTFVVGRLGMDRDEQRRYLDDPDPVAAGQRLADKIFNQDRSFLLKRYPDQPGGRLLVDAWMSLNEPIEGPSWEGAAQQDDAWHRTNTSMTSRLWPSTSARATSSRRSSISSCIPKRWGNTLISASTSTAGRPWPST